MADPRIPSLDPLIMEVDPSDGMSMINEAEADARQVELDSLAANSGFNPNAVPTGLTLDGVPLMTDGLYRHPAQVPNGEAGSTRTRSPNGSALDERDYIADSLPSRPARPLGIAPPLNPTFPPANEGNLILSASNAAGSVPSATLFSAGRV